MGVFEEHALTLDELMDTVVAMRILRKKAVLHGRKNFQLLRDGGQCFFVSCSQNSTRWWKQLGIPWNLVTPVLKIAVLGAPWVTVLKKKRHRMCWNTCSVNS